MWIRESNWLYYRRQSQGRNEVYGIRDQRPKKGRDLGSQRVGSGPAVFPWNQGSGWRQKRVQGSKFFSFLGSGINILGENMESVRKKYTSLWPCYLLMVYGNIVVRPIVQVILFLHASVHMARHVWTWFNIMKQSFSTPYLTFFFLFMQRDYGKFALKQLDYSPSSSFST